MTGRSRHSHSCPLRSRVRSRVLSLPLPSLQSCWLSWLKSGRAALFGSVRGKCFPEMPRAGIRRVFVAGGDISCRPFRCDIVAVVGEANFAPAVRRAVAIIRRVRRPQRVRKCGAVPAELPSSARISTAPGGADPWRRHHFWPMSARCRSAAKLGEKRSFSDAAITPAQSP